MAGPTAGDTPDLIWLRPQPDPIPRVALTRDQIAGAAVTLADTGGVEALSMRQLASSLGCGTMSLYRHVRTKDELFQLMIDRVAGEELRHTPARTGNWRTDLAAIARVRRASALRHPWLPRLQAGRPCLGPNVVATGEHALSVVADLGLPIEDMLRIIRTVDAFVLGAVQVELSERELRPPPDPDEENWYTQTVAYLRQLSETGDYPHFTRMLTEAEQLAPEADFEWQLERILDGFAATIPGPRTTPQPDRPH